jgi:hypothetical protein
MLNSDVGEGKVLSQQDLDPFDFREGSKEDGDVKSSVLLCKRDVSSQKDLMKPAASFQSATSLGLDFQFNHANWSARSRLRSRMMFHTLGVISGLGVLSTGSKHFYELI